MIFCYSCDKEDKITQTTILPALKKNHCQLPENCFWIDITEPNDDEINWLNYFFNETPDVKDIEEIEATSRLYINEDGVHISSLFPQKKENEIDTLSVSFTLKKDLLVTLRSEDISLFRLMRNQIKIYNTKKPSAYKCLLSLFNNKIDYLADLIEEQYQFVDQISIKEFNDPDFDFDHFLQDLTRIQTNTGKIHMNLIDAQRSLRFLMKTIQIPTQESNVINLTELLRDIDSLIPHTTFLFDKINFLIDACMGFININQNKIIKIFSVLAVVFMPPTLIASIYGMNFAMMPELNWKYGYWISIMLMFISSVATYSLFKFKKWL